MTEKRFMYIEIEEDTVVWYDNGAFHAYDDEGLEEFLNDWSEENEQLKFELHKLNILYKAKCKTEEQLLEMGKEVEKENEQLKSENNMLKVTIGRNEAYIQRLTETSEWHC